MINKVKFHCNIHLSEFLSLELFNLAQIKFHAAVTASVALSNWSSSVFVMDVVSNLLNLDHVEKYNRTMEVPLQWQSWQVFACLRDN